jgi:hypothetical protein
MNFELAEIVRIFRTLTLDVFTMVSLILACLFVPFYARWVGDNSFYMPNEMLWPPYI